MKRWNALSAMIFFSALVCAGICFGTECDWSKFPTEKGEFDSSWESLEKYDKKIKVFWKASLCESQRYLLHW
jgi:hypothetical protein